MEKEVTTNDNPSSRGDRVLIDCLNCDHNDSWHTGNRTECSANKCKCEKFNPTPSATTKTLEEILDKYRLELGKLHPAENGVGAYMKLNDEALAAIDQTRDNWYKGGKGASL